MSLRLALGCMACAALVVVGELRASVDHYDVEDGLSQNSVVAIASDARGLLWLGTEDGLNRFDGNDFRVFRSEPGRPGLPDGFIQRLARHEEVLWIGTVGGGLARMHLPSERIEAMRDALPEAGPAQRTIHAVLPLSETRALVGSAQGLHEVDWPLDGGSPRVRRIEALAEDRLVRVLAALPDGRVAVAGQGGACLLDAGFGECRRLDLELGANAGDVSALALAGDGRLWFGVDSHGLVILDPDRAGSQRLDFGDARLPATMARAPALAPAGAEGDLWIGSDLGVFRYRKACDCVGERIDGEGEDPTARKIVYALGVDGERLWLGAWNHGLDRYDPARQAIERHRPRLDERSAESTRTVRALLPEGDTLWLGTFGAGAIRARPGPGQTLVYEQPAELRPGSVGASLVWALARDSHGALWIGSDAGLQRWTEGGPAERVRASASAGGRVRAVRALYRDRSGRIWVASEAGLAYVDSADPASGVHPVGGDEKVLPDRSIFAVHEDRAGRFWLATWLGVYAFDAASLRVGVPLVPDAGLRITWDIADADDGGLWIGSSDGLVHAAADGSWRRYTERDGLANRVIYGIQQDADGRLWLSSNGGLMRFDARTGEVVNFGRHDDLQQIEFLFGAHAQDGQGRMLFGGPVGFNRVDPRRVELGDSTPLAVLTGVRIDGIQQDGGAGRYPLAAPSLQRIELAPQDSVLELHYGAIAYDQPRELRYRYRLVGFDRDWQQARERRFASYTNLPAGEFRFEVEAVSRFGRVSQAPRSLAVAVIPWWWESLWFRTLLAVLALCTAAAMVGWRISDLRAQRRELAAQVVARTRELQAQRDELARVNGELAALSTRDPLTGLANRRSLLAALQAAIAAATADASPLAIAVVDLDHFKRVNDSRGHAAGDQALMHIATLWPPALPPGALLGRYGGEEFLLLLPGHDAAAATRAVEGLLASLRASAVAGLDPPLQLTASVGIAQFAVGESLEALINRADAALYAAKRGGRDGCRVG